MYSYFVMVLFLRAQAECSEEIRYEQGRSCVVEYESIHQPHAGTGEAVRYGD